MTNHPLDVLAPIALAVLWTLSVLMEMTRATVLGLICVIWLSLLMVAMPLIIQGMRKRLT